jgi:hypothetical protein
MNRMTWDNKDQSLFECADIGLRGLKRGNWITLQEYEKILNLLHSAFIRRQNGK